MHEISSESNHEFSSEVDSAKDTTFDVYEDNKKFSISPQEFVEECHRQSIRF